jgi:predicted HNH restriction endonuclease
MVFKIGHKHSEETKRKISMTETFTKFNTLCSTCHKIQHIKNFVDSEYGGLI